MPESEKGDYFFIGCPACKAEIIVYVEKGDISMVICGRCKEPNAIADDGYDDKKYDTAMWGEVGLN